MSRVVEAGLADYLELIEEPDYLAMPRMVANGDSFDFILIDGWHSFDYTMLDLFFADLLLRCGGVVALHDTCMPSVNRACRFLETHKPYDRMCPPIGVTKPSLAGRLGRRGRQMLGGPTVMREARRRRTEWYSLAAYRKKECSIVPDDFFANF